MKRKVKYEGMKIQLDEDRSVWVGKSDEIEGYLIRCKSKHEGREWKTARVSRDENNIVTLTFSISREGASALVNILLKLNENDK